MKLLLIGMDGTQDATFNRGWTPFIATLFEKGSSLLLKEDLVSRGWAEIMLGQHGSVSKALYEGPIADGTHGWTEKYKLADTPELGVAIRPIWQVLNELGYKVGIMNVPTTFPAPKVDGFFVSGGGGGGPIVRHVASDQCYPPEIQRDLLDLNYIVDERLPSLLGERKIFDPKDFYSQIQHMNEKRSEGFVKLSKFYNVDFGFVVYRSTVIAETLVLPELERCRSIGEESEFLNATEQFYRHLDNEIKRLIENFPDAQIIFVSDHSMTLRKWSVNLNVFLSKIGMQKPSSAKNALYSFTKSFKHLVPFSIRKYLKKSSTIKLSYESMTTFEKKTSKAFSVSFSNGQNGIFINDKRRFGGPVATEDVLKLKINIINEFNSDLDCINHGLKAYGSNENSVDNFPDIVVDFPDGYLTNSEQVRFIKQYSPNVSKFDLKEAAKGKLHTIKGHYPLAVNINGNWLVKPNNEISDLRVVYNHIADFFKRK